MNDPSATLDRLAAHAEQLYSLPAVAMEVLQLTGNPQVDTRALKECIENDPALTGKILRVVNSSLFALSREISDLNQALALLGTKPLKLLVLGFSLPGGLYAGIEARTLARYSAPHADQGGGRPGTGRTPLARPRRRRLHRRPVARRWHLAVAATTRASPTPCCSSGCWTPGWNWTPWRPRRWVFPIRRCRPGCWPAGTCRRIWSKRSRPMPGRTLWRPRPPVQPCRRFSASPS